MLAYLTSGNGRYRLALVIEGVLEARFYYACNVIDSVENMRAGCRVCTKTTKCPAHYRMVAKPTNDTLTLQVPDTLCKVIDKDPNRLIAMLLKCVKAGDAEEIYLALLDACGANARCV